MAEPAADAALLERARAWRDADPDPDTRAELDRLLSGGDVGTLADMFAADLEFGTAGLRGRLGPGPNRMNRAVVIRTAAGLMEYLSLRIGSSRIGSSRIGRPRVVVGYDARRKSDAFARDTCGVVTAAGAEALLLPGPLPTPVLAFAVRHLEADAGVMVTASHNPAADNGYKVYLGGRAAEPAGRGAQIVPPADAQISAAIAAAPPASDVPRSEGWRVLGPDLLDRYLHAAASTARPGPRELSVVLTSLHGVGGPSAVAALALAGFSAPHVVAEQARPDPAFPTLSFPNPEEPGALDLALAMARETGADLVIANDPDADRCAVAVPDPGASGGWRQLSGDQVGGLLGEHLLARGVPALVDGVPPAVACSVVSSQLLGRIAAAHGVRHAETLTGFKWISRPPGLVFGYEEAIGYCVAPDVVRDKDGISAAVLVCDLAARMRAGGRTLLDAWDDLERAHGVHATDALSLRVDDVALIAAAMRRLRADPPLTLGGAEVTSRQDLLDDGGGLPPTDGLRYRTADGVRVVVRPSGTEPKLKCYLESVVPVAGGLDPARALARSRLDAVRADLAARLDPGR